MRISGPSPGETSILRHVDAVAWSLPALPHNVVETVYSMDVPTTDAAPFAFRDDELDRLARLEHERWMQERTQQGWRYGSVRDDQRKLHPDLVDWAELSDESAEKDRAAVRNIPRLLRATGFQILRLEQ